MNKIEGEGILDEHRRWREEHASWLIDVDRWQNDHQAAVFDLDRLQALVTDHGDAVRAHSDAIVLHDRASAQHEEELERFRGSGFPGNPSVTRHRDFRTKHEQAREAHARIGKHHETVVTQLRKLVAAMAEAL